MSQQSPQQTDQPVAKIDWPAVIAGAAAAVTVAVLLSTLGAAGTLVGAALGSVVATVSTALYKQGIYSSRRKMAEVQAGALMRVGMAQEELRRAAAHAESPTVAGDLARADAHLDKASSGLSDAAESGEVEQDPAPQDAAGAAAANDAPVAEEPTDEQPGHKRMPVWAEVPWRRVALLAVAVFVVAVVVISAFELIAGRSVSTLTGGSDDKRTSLTGLFGDSTGGKQHRKPTPTPTPSPTATTTAPTDQPTSQAPTTPAPTGPSTPAPTGPEQPGDSATPSDTASAETPAAADTAVATP